MTKLEIMEDALDYAMSALALISSPARPDGTYNRSREACGRLARETLEKIDHYVTTNLQQETEQLEPKPQLLLEGEDKKYIVYSDGGCSGNPGPVGWGAVVVLDGVVVKEGQGFKEHGTNQIAELLAATEGLKLTPVGSKVELVSDSQYVVKGLSEWRKAWEKSGWLNAKKETVANKEYWQKLFEESDKRKVTSRWVKGHSGDLHNNRCHLLAAQAIRIGS